MANKQTDTVRIYRGAKREWRWVRLSANGKIVGASTEGYIHRADCIHNALAQLTAFTVVVEKPRRLRVPKPYVKKRHFRTYQD